MWKIKFEENQNINLLIICILYMFLIYFFQDNGSVCPPISHLWVKLFIHFLR